MMRTGVLDVGLEEEVAAVDQFNARVRSIAEECLPPTRQTSRGSHMRTETLMALSGTSGHWWISRLWNCCMKAPRYIDNMHRHSSRQEEFRDLLIEFFQESYSGVS